MSEAQKKVIKVNLRYDFTEREKKDIATLLANANQRKVALEEQKKQVDADLKAQITEAESMISRESRKYTNGYEYRDIDCEVFFHLPVRGQKSVFRTDTGELIREAAMEPHELQDNLFREETEA